MNVDDVTFVMPSYNTLSFTMMAYHSIRKYYPENEIIILDDGSTDNSFGWIDEQLKLDDNLRGWFNITGNIIGHTITYDIGIKMAKNPLVSIFHSDMICCRGYLENLIKHWKLKTVVCATRIEPEGIYPPGKEKILKPFGKEIHEFKRKELDEFVEQEMVASKNKTIRGIFAPWMISKEDFLAIGGHDAKSFAPYPEEDADLFLRFHLAEYTIIQSRDSLCWHWISRGHRGWAKNGVGHDDDKFQFYQNRARRNYIRKWHKWMQFDEWHHPVAHKVFRVGFIVTGVTSIDFLHAIEPWASHIYVDNAECVKQYLDKEQPTTKILLRERIINIQSSENGVLAAQPVDDVILIFNEKDFMTNLNDNMRVIINLTDILSNDIDNNSEFEYGIFRMKTGKLNDISKTLIKI
jgi:glycosyltransferase involved in cell wall biosynthesis